MAIKKSSKKLLKELMVEQKVDHDQTVWVDKNKKQVFLPRLKRISTRKEV